MSLKNDTDVVLRGVQDILLAIITKLGVVISNVEHSNCVGIFFSFDGCTSKSVQS